MPKKLPQKNLVSKKLSVFADESDEEVSSTIFFRSLPHILQIICLQSLMPASAYGSVMRICVIILDLSVKYGLCFL